MTQIISSGQLWKWFAFPKHIIFVSLWISVYSMNKSVIHSFLLHIAANNHPKRKKKYLEYSSTQSSTLSIFNSYFKSRHSALMWKQEVQGELKQSGRCNIFTEEFFRVPFKAVGMTLTMLHSEETQKKQNKARQN